MDTTHSFRPYDPDQLLLLPPDLRAWLPEDHPALFLKDVVAQLDLSALYGALDHSRGGRPGYDPRLLVSLLLYGYCTGTASSRQLERLTHESVAYRVLCCDQHPDHDTIAEFRRRHLEALAQLFVQVLRLCEQAGLVKLGCVSLDGTKVKANASKHKAMSYGRMAEKIAALEAEVQRLLEEAEALDRAEDARYGKGRRGDELPEALRRRETRLAKIREAKAALEREAHEEAERLRAERARDDDARRQAGKKPKCPPPAPPSETPADTAQKNFTDPDSRVMKDGATRAFVQAYNAQVAVDTSSQVILAAHVTQAGVDNAQAVPLVEGVKANLGGRPPRRVVADNGYYSEKNVQALAAHGIDAYIATAKEKHAKPPEAGPKGRIPQAATLTQRMARKLQTKQGRAVYKKRKETVEPVLGQIKQARGFRQFLLRGLTKVSGEWGLICTGHNLLKLWRSGWVPAAG